jgi:hypothetical protein
LALCLLQSAGFPQDRAVLYNMYPAPDGSVMWEVRVHAIFYQASGCRRAVCQVV